jgi:hypothetical protein
MVLILRNEKLEKTILETSRFNLSTDFGGFLKIHFGEQKMRCLPNAQIHIVWYIRNFFDCLEVSKGVFIWNMIYIRVPVICFKSYQQPNFIQLTRQYSFICRLIFWYINMVLILRTQTVEKSLLEISRFNLSAEFVGVIKTHFGELKMRVVPTATIHKILYIRNIFECLEISKCVFIWNMIYISVHLICFKSYQHPNFYQLSRL